MTKTQHSINEMKIKRADIRQRFDESARIVGTDEFPCMTRFASLFLRKSAEKSKYYDFSALFCIFVEIFIHFI